jgi:tRNA modification GTPase
MTIIANSPPTLIALLTAPGHGALATIGVRGPAAERIALQCLTEPVPAASRHKQPWLRHFRSSEHSTEELVVTFPRSDEVRLHCHGGLAACEAVMHALEQAGASRTVWQDWLPRESLTPLQRSARVALSQALTEPASLILLDQLQGAFTRAVQQCLGLLQEAKVEELERWLNELLAWAPLGQHLTSPWSVVIAGAPNAGKSSLLNALLGFQRSIISPQPGTTRDVVTARTAIAGWPVELRDTAGQRESTDLLEALGVKLARKEQAAADLVLLVVPATESNDFLPAEDRVLVVRSKIDLVTDARISLRDGEFAVSAQSGQGIAELLQAIAKRLVPREPPPLTAIPWTRFQAERLRQCQRALRVDLFHARSHLEAILTEEETD